MGILCSTTYKKGDVPLEEGKSKAQEHSQPSTSPPRKLRKMPQFTGPSTRSQPKSNWRDAIEKREFDSPEEYRKALDNLQLAEKAGAFDHEVIATASKNERRAADLVRKIKLYDLETTYGNIKDSNGYAIEKRPQAEHFLGNVDHINKTELMKIAKRMPKGAHLHIHFNSCLPARFLIRQARDIDAMYIRSTMPLTTPQNWKDSRISFMVMTVREATHLKDANGLEKEVELGNIFQPQYISNRWMSYQEFQRNFRYVDETMRMLSGTKGAETWLERKMLISEEEAHGTRQTGRG
jgi:adenosine deaminase CECR1